MTYDKISLQKWALALVILFTAPFVSAQTGARSAAQPTTQVTPPALPELEVNSDITFTVETKRHGSRTDFEKGSDFRRALFFGKSNQQYQYSMDYFESDKGLQGRFCQLSTAGSLFDCFTVMEKSEGGKAGCLITPYNASKDFPKLKRGYSESDLNRAFQYTAIKSETARQQLLRTNLGRAGTASTARFQPLSISYSKDEKIALGPQGSPVDFIRARGAVVCKRLHETILPAYKAREEANKKRQQTAPAKQQKSRSAD